VISRSSVLAVSLLVAAVSFTGAAEPPAKPARAHATFAGGCFWCMEPPFEKIPGVFSVTSGYTGGQKKNPTYEEVSAGITGHAESVDIVYDPAKVTYAQLLEVFWHNIDPFTSDAQFCDHGTQYRSAIFYHDDDERRLAEETKKQVQERFHMTVATQVVAATQFYPAEEYHQDFYMRNPLRYHTYRSGCGRDQRLKEIWGASAATH